MKKTIRILFLAVSFCLVSPLLSWADSSKVIQMTGLYTYLNHYKIVQKKVKEMVSVNTEQGKQQMAALKAQGFTCMYKMNMTYECSQFVTPEQKNEKIEELLALEFKGRDLNFAKEELSIEQTNDSEYLKEFTINNPLSFGDFSVDSYNYQILKDDLHKISFVNPKTKDKYYFNVVDINVAQVPKIITFQSGNQSSVLYFVLADYEHQCCPIND